MTETSSRLPLEILLVEDNPADVRIAREALKAAGFAHRLNVVMDGEEALDFLLRRGAHAGAPHPDLVLLDLKLPRLDGLQVLQRVRANPATRRLPVVILTSSKEQRDLVDGYDLGVNSYIRKPVDFQEFVVAVRRLGLYWLLLNQPPPHPPT
jgi:two-component system response regulator